LPTKVIYPTNNETSENHLSILQVVRPINSVLGEPTLSQGDPEDRTWLAEERAEWFDYFVDDEDPPDSAPYPNAEILEAEQIYPSDVEEPVPVEAQRAADDAGWEVSEDDELRDWAWRMEQNPG